MRFVYSILLLTVLFEFPSTLFSQSKRIDSLLNELTLLDKKESTIANDSTKAKVLNALAWQMGNYSEKYDTALSFAERAIIISEKINWVRGQVDGYSSKGKILKNQNKHQEAITNYKKSAELSRSVNQKDWIAGSLYFIGQINIQQGDYANALDNLLQALRLNEETGNQESIARDQTYLGILHTEIDDYDNALDYHLKAVKIYEEQKNKIWTAINLQAIASIYRNQNNYSKAIEYYNRVLDMQKGNVYSTYMMYVDLGHVYEHLSANTSPPESDSAAAKAMKYYSQGLETALKIQDGKASGLAYNGLGLLNLRNNKLKQADSALNNALKFLLSEKDPEGLKDCYYNLSLLDSAKGDWKSSLANYKQFALISDSLFNKKKSREVARLQIKHVTDEKEAEISLLNKENEFKIKQQQKNILLIIASAIILLIIAGVYLNYRNKKVKQQSLKQISEAKLASLKSLMDKHFIFSSLHSIDTFLMKNDTEAASDYLVKYSKLIRSILEMSNQAEVSLEEEISLCRSYLDLEKIRLDNKFDYEFSIDGNIAVKQTLFPSMLLQPLVENAVKHGIGSITSDNTKKGLIKIDIARQNDKLICRVTDNGKGLQFSSSGQTHRSYSGKGIIERVKVYNNLRKNAASFLLSDNNPGVTAVLTLPYLSIDKSIAV